MRKFSLLILILILLPGVTNAANGCSEYSTGGLVKCVSQIYLWAIGISGILALLMTILGSYLVMTSGGNAEQATKGKDFIWSAIVGLGLLFGSWLILNTINPDLVNLKDPFAKPLPTNNQPSKPLPQLPIRQ